MEEMTDSDSVAPRGLTENYCIRSDYMSRIPDQPSEISDSFDWSEDRIRDSGRYQWSVYKVALKYSKMNNHRRVIDVGCGPATKLMSLFPQTMERVGVDQSMAIEHCRRTYSGGQFFVDDFDNPGLQIDKKFDMVICCDVIEHVEDPDSLIAYIKRFCSADTYVVLSTPDRDRLRGKDCLSSPKKDHLREWNEREFRNYLVTRGFELIEHYHLLPVKLEFSWLFIRHLVAQLRRFRSPSYNQVAICKVAA